MNVMDNRVALITGASRRIGACIAQTLHESGLRVCLHYRNAEQPAQTLADELNSTRPDSAHLLQADLHAVEKLPALIEKTVQHFGQLDCLINNASSFYATPVGTITPDDWEDLLGSNLKAPLFLSQAAAPALSKAGGCIVNIIDIHAERPMPGHSVYNIAKAGLWATTRSLARELAPDIRVNGIAPGAILWPENETDEARQQELLSRIPLQRTGSPADIANAVVFFVRDAPYITGHMLPVDGGQLLNI